MGGGGRGGGGGGGGGGGARGASEAPFGGLVGALLFAGAPGHVPSLPCPLNPAPCPRTRVCRRHDADLHAGSVHL